MESQFTVIEEVRIEEPTKDTAMEAEVKAAQQRAVIPLEDRVQQFKAMLAEKEVAQVQNFVCFHSSHGIEIRF
jgi:hypothetical protein